MFTRFRPSLWASVATGLACALFLAAGFWQLDRAAERTAQHRVMEAARNAAPYRLKSAGDVAAQVGRRVIASGQFVDAGTLLIDNKVLDGRVGFHVVTPLQMADASRMILVNRGWVAANPQRTVIPSIPTPRGIVSIEGLVVEPPGRVFELGTPDPSQPIWPNLILERYGRAKGLALEPVVLLQLGEAADGLVRRWEAPTSLADRNRGYAVQWFSFALVTLIFYVVLHFKRSTPHA